MSHAPFVGQSQNVLASARTLVDVEPFYLGRHRQLHSPSVFAQYFASVHVPLPNVAIWISVIIHLLGGMALLVGFNTRWAATLLGLLSVGTAFVVHLPSGDRDNMIHFYKNLVMTCGFLYVIAFGAGAVSIDGRTSDRAIRAHVSASMIERESTLQ